MNNDLTNLIKLQGYDLELDILKKKEGSLQQEIERMKEEIQRLSESLSAAKSGLTQLQLRKKEMEGEIDAKDQQMKKFQSELNSVKTNDAYKALMMEIEQSKLAKDSMEEKLLDVLQEIEDQQKDLKHQEQNHKNREQVLKEEIQNAEKFLADTHARAQEKSRHRESYAQGIAEPLRTRYMSIRKSKGGPVVVAIQGDTCGGCRQKIPLHLTNEVKKDQSLVACDSCARILFLEPSPSIPFASQ